MSKVMTVLLLLIFCAGSINAQGKAFTGKDWIALDKGQRVKAVSDFIKDAKEEGVTIKNDAVLYCKRMDAFYAKNPKTLSEAPGKILKTLMIMEYDWKIKGTDPEMTAKNWLGEKLYKENLARLKR